MSIYSQWFVNYFAFENFATIHILKLYNSREQKNQKTKTKHKKTKKNQKNKTKKISEFTSTKVEMRFKYCKLTFNRVREFFATFARASCSVANNFWDEQVYVVKLLWQNGCEGLLSQTSLYRVNRKIMSPRIKHGLTIYGFILLAIRLNRSNVYTCYTSIDIDAHMHVYILNNLTNNRGLFVYKFINSQACTERWSLNQLEYYCGSEWSKIWNNLAEQNII